MAIDWKPELRGDFEAAMKEGLAVVNYDCKSLKLQPACSLEGSYGYLGTTRREKTIEMSTKDELAANLPVGGLTWLSDLGAKFGRGTSLAARLVMVGKQSAGKKQATKGDLKGGCDGATHYVRAATIGAFVVASGSQAELAANVKIVGKGASAGSTSQTKIQSEDGDVEACQKSTSDDKRPPEQCGALVRIELEPIGAGGRGPDAAPPDVEIAMCPSGFARGDDGVCRKPDKPHQCKLGDGGDCAKQCEAGSANSCATLASMHKNGTGVAKDWAKAASFAQRACAKDVMAGCRIVATAKLGGEGTAKDVKGAIFLLDKACKAGEGAACVDLGVAELGLKDKKGAENAQYSFRRACYGGGQAEGCAWLGTLYAEGKGGLTASPKLAVSFFEKGCKDGSGRACEGLGELLKAGKGVAKDAARAKELFTKACTAGHATACNKK
ncbi:MAG: sel1 repeat family protein [Deltaproteobacteria bacterium]|nr:sel1 repeat family protein [Deltaproteobacteria bacterium]